MREIKFRVYDTVNKCFISDVSNFWINPSFTAMMEWRPELDGQTTFDLNDSLVFQQYTGLKDKNGVEVYEGDIINNYEEYNNIKVVNYDPYRCYFCLIDFDEWPDIMYNGEMFNVAGEGSNFSNRIDIVGNIFEGLIDE